MEKSEALKKAINHLRLLGMVATMKEVAKAMGADPSNISRHIKGQPEPTDKFMRRFNEAFGSIFNEEWLIGGKGEMLATDVTMLGPASTEEFTITKNGTRFDRRNDGKLLMRVPLVPFSALGSPADEFAELDKTEADTITIEVTEVHHGSYYAFRVEGDSMDDGTRKSFERGDIVVVRELGRDKWLPKLHYKDWPYWVVCFGNNVRLKEVVAHDGPTITLHSINPSPEYTDFTLNLDDVQRLFNVVKKVPKEVNFGD